jgi:hypothetical protein
MSSYRLDHKRNIKGRPVTEHECMIKFYEPIDDKQKVLKKWLRKPER